MQIFSAVCLRGLVMCLFQRVSPYGFTVLKIQRFFQQLCSLNGKSKPADALNFG